MKNLLGFSSSTIGIAAINFLSVMILTRVFTPEDYGSANLLISYSIVLSTIILVATDQVIMHYYYDYSLKSIINNAKKLSITIVFGFFTTGLILSMVSNISYLEILLISGYSVSLALNRVYMTLFRMEKAPKNYLIQGAGVKSLELILVLVLVLVAGTEYYFIILPYILSVLVVNSLQYLSIKKIINKSDSKFVGITRKKQMDFAIPLMFTILITSIVQHLDKIILNNFVSSTDLGIYYSAFKIIGIVTIIHTVIALVWTPVAINLSKKLTNYNEFLRNSVLINQFISLWVIVFYILFQNLILFILGSSYVDAVSLVALLLGLPLFMIISEPYSTFITISKETKVHVRISLLLLSSSLIITIPLAYFYGISGASHSILLTYFLLYIYRSIAASILYKKRMQPLYEIIMSVIIFLLILLLYHSDNLLGLLIVIITIIIFMSIYSYKNITAIIQIIRES